MCLRRGHYNVFAWNEYCLCNPCLWWNSGQSVCLGVQCQACKWCWHPNSAKCTQLKSQMLAMLAWQITIVNIIFPQIFLKFISFLEPYNYHWHHSSLWSFRFHAKGIKLGRHSNYHNQPLPSGHCEVHRSKYLRSLVKFSGVWMSHLLHFMLPR